jgi:hypothetical protein
MATSYQVVLTGVQLNVPAEVPALSVIVTDVAPLATACLSALSIHHRISDASARFDEPITFPDRFVSEMVTEPAMSLA